MVAVHGGYTWRCTWQVYMVGVHTCIMRHTRNEGTSNTICWLKGSFSFPYKLARAFSFLAIASVQGIPEVLNKKKMTSLFSTSKMNFKNVLERNIVLNVLALNGFSFLELGKEEYFYCSQALTPHSQEWDKGAAPVWRCVPLLDSAFNVSLSP